LRGLQIPQIRELVGYRRKWKGHIERMSSEKILKRILKHQQMGRKKDFRKTLEMTGGEGGFCFIISIGFLSPSGWGLDAVLTTLLCKKKKRFIVAK
jgi:hypothetical protein